MRTNRRPTGSKRPHVLGLVGGVASGKSTVAALLAERGAVVVDADKICHEALDTAPVKARVVRAFGDVLDASGAIDRAALRRVFDDERALRTLESILHPIVRDAITDAHRRAAALGLALLVIDAPLLFEAGLASECDAVVFVDAPPARREAWAAARDWSPAELARREANQWPVDRKRRAADHVITNDAGLDELERAVDALWSTVTSETR